MLILYGSQTGNAQVSALDAMYVCGQSIISSNRLPFEQDVAERIAREGKRRHFAPRVMAMDAFPVTSIPEERIVVFVCSTTGQASSDHSLAHIQQPYLLSPANLEYCRERFLAI